MLNAGDAFLYDSRLLHRSAANRRYDRTAAVLVFRYDFERPPGMGCVEEGKEGKSAGSKSTTWGN